LEEYDYEEIRERYEYADKICHTSVLFFPDKNIATVTETTDDLGSIDTEIKQYGMTRDELIEYFPQASKSSELPYNLAKIIRSIIHEAYQKEGLELEHGNVRNFWYTHLKTTITKILGLGETPSVLTTINQAWGEMINSGLVTYEGLNITGGSDRQRICIVKDSPFSSLIIAVGNADYFEHLSWIPKLFNSTLITAGGQPSRAVARAFILQLQKLGVNLDQQFYMCVASDLDPAGYYIQEAFRKQLEAAIVFYGGSGKVDIKRLFVRRDQVSDNLLTSDGMPCRDKAKTEKARKAETTKWEHFCEETGGGLYIPVPPNWDGPIFEVNGEPVVRALLEMNAFPKHIIEKSVLKELLKIIEETNDESKIMIPEIMRIFEVMREESVNDTFDEWKHKLIKPLIDEFLKQTDNWKTNITSTYFHDKHEASQKCENAIDPIDDKYQQLIDDKYQEARNREPDLYDEKDNLEDQIADLEAQLDDVNESIQINCSDIFEDIDDLKTQKKNDIKPFEEQRDKEYAEAAQRRDYRLDKLQQFRDEHATVFNPLEMALKADIADSLSPTTIEYYFRDLEEMERFQPHIARLLTTPALLYSGISCFDQDVPTFTEKDLLTKASRRQDENVGSVRNAFPPKFTTEMKYFLKEHIKDREFELSGEVEQKDLTNEITQARDETEEEIEQGLWKEDEEDEEDEEDDDDDDEE